MNRTCKPPSLSGEPFVKLWGCTSETSNPVSKKIWDVQTFPCFPTPQLFSPNRQPTFLGRPSVVFHVFIRLGRAGRLCCCNLHLDATRLTRGASSVKNHGRKKKTSLSNGVMIPYQHQWTMKKNLGDREPQRAWNGACLKELIYMVNCWFGARWFGIRIGCP